MKEKLQLFDVDTISNLKYTLKIKSAVHTRVSDIFWLFIFYCSQKSHHTDTVFMVVMPLGYDKKKNPLMVCDEREERVHYPKMYSRGLDVSL